MVRGCPSIAAAVVSRRNTLIWIRRRNPARSKAPWFHQASAAGRCTWCSRASASHTFTSRKLNEVIDLFAGQSKRLSAACRDQRGVEAEAAGRALGLGFLDCSFDAAEDELAGRASLTGGHHVETAMQGDGNVQGGTYGGLVLHSLRVADRLK